MELLKLQSASNFVLQQFDLLYSAKITQDEYVTRTKKYMDFLSKPLLIEMFVPCDEDGNVLDAEPCSLGMFAKGNPFFDVYLESKNKWDEAKERCLFEFNSEFLSFDNYDIDRRNVEDLLLDDLEYILTQNAIKQIL